MSHRTTLTEHVAEKATCQLTATIQDESGNALPAASITTLALTLYDEASESVLNGRSFQDILNLNGGTVDANGNLVLTLDPLDNIVINPARQLETHVALIEWTYGTKSGKHEIAFPVANLAKVA